MCTYTVYTGNTVNTHYETTTVPRRNIEKYQDEKK